jgi:hypothetical protein
LPTVPPVEGRARVPRIVTDCTVTGQPIETGIEIDEASFALLPDFVGKIFCFHCKAEHEWSKQSARVVDDAKPKP